MSPIDSSFESSRVRVKLARFVHPINASLLIVTTLDGIVTLEMSVLANDLLPIYVNVLSFSKVNKVNIALSSNNESITVVTSFGISMEIICLFFKKLSSAPRLIMLLLFTLVFPYMITL